MKCPCGEPELPPHDMDQHDRIVELDAEATGFYEYLDEQEPTRAADSWWDPKLEISDRFYPRD